MDSHSEGHDQARKWPASLPRLLLARVQPDCPDLTAETKSEKQSRLGRQGRKKGIVSIGPASLTPT